MELLVLSDHDSKLTGPDAVKFFERSQLPRPLLAKVWALADSARKGYLDPSTFAKVFSNPIPYSHCTATECMFGRLNGRCCTFLNHTLHACDIGQHRHQTVTFSCCHKLVLQE